jgi:hypothetical protein
VEHFTGYVLTLELRMLLVLSSAPLAPNARFQPRLEAEAQRTL